VFDGRDPLPALEEQARSPHRALYWKWNQGRKQQWRGMRAGKYKLLRSTDNAPWELYDLASDIGEQHDLAAREPNKVQELTADFEQWLAQIEADPTRSMSLRKE
jgi:arylsulfatase A-like enzyme